MTLLCNVDCPRCVLIIISLMNGKKSTENEKHYTTMERRKNHIGYCA